MEFERVLEEFQGFIDLAFVCQPQDGTKRG